MASLKWLSLAFLGDFINRSDRGSRSDAIVYYTSYQQSRISFRSHNLGHELQPLVHIFKSQFRYRSHVPHSKTFLQCLIEYAHIDKFRIRRFFCST